ncbi:MAG: MFS transporter [Sphingobium sp.]
MQAGQGISGSSEWRAHWTVVMPCIAGIMLCAAHGYSLGVMIGPLEREFGWTRAEISTGPLLISLIALVGAPLVGGAVDRYGPRRIALFGILFFCGMLASLSLATSNIFLWWALWAVLGSAGMFVIPTVWTAAITSLFVAARGTALAISLTGTSLCAAITPPLTDYLVETQGWRGAYVGLAAIYAVIVFPLAWIFFRSTADAKGRAQAGEAAAPPPAGYSVKEGMTSPAFIKLAAAIIVFSIALSALTTNAVPILIAQGLTTGQAASVAGVIGLGSLAGRIGGGFLLDRFNASRVAAASVLAPVAAVLILIAAPGSTGMAIVAALILGLSVGAEVDACAYLAARHFGLRSFGALFGAINGLMLFSNGLAPMIANFVYDMTHSYHIFLWATLPLCAAAAALFLAMGPYPEAEEEDVPGGVAVTVH